MDETVQKKGFKDGIRVGVLIMVPVSIITAAVFILILVGTGVLRPHLANRGADASAHSQMDRKIGEINGYINQFFIFDMKPEHMVDSALKGYVAGLDDIYSGYFTADEYRKKMEATNGSFVGIGVSVQQEAENGVLKVWNVYPGSPADQAGMKVGDIITGVDGISVIGQSLSDVVTLIRGEEGSDVVVQVLRGEQTLELTMTRATVDKETVVYDMKDDNIGYIELVEFDNVSVDQMKNALTDLQSRGMKKLILDLRGNPGGALNSVLGIADLFLPEANIFYAMNKAGDRTNYNSTADQVCTEEMVILVDGASASAAEVLSGSLKDNQRATLVGDQTYGKGIIQSYYELSDGSAVKLTVAHYFTPNGTDIHGVGISPDVALADDPATADVDEQLEKALELLR